MKFFLLLILDHRRRKRKRARRRRTDGQKESRGKSVKFSSHLHGMLPGKILRRKKVSLPPFMVHDGGC